MGDARQMGDRFYACFATGDWDGARIVEHNVVFDQLTFLSQPGAAPS